MSHKLVVLPVLLSMASACVTTSERVVRRGDPGPIADLEATSLLTEVTVEHAIPIRGQAVLVDGKDRRPVALAEAPIVEEARQLRFDGDKLSWRSPMSPTRREVPLANVSALGFRRPRSEERGKMIAMAAGFVLGGMVGYAVGSDCSDNRSWGGVCFGREFTAFVMTAPFTLLGLALGSASGHYERYLLAE